MLKGKRLALIGSGMMAEAMIKGLLRQELVTPEQLMTAGPRAERGEELAKRYSVQWSTDNCQASTDHDIVILSIKPQVIQKVMVDMQGELRSHALVLSIVAGVPIKTIMNGLAHAAIVRAMPNTPAQIGEGITVWTGTAEVDDMKRAQARSILGALGEEIYVEDECFLDMATALSGTGPAYVLLFMEAMIDAGVHLGFSRRIAKRLVIQTMRGTVAYAQHSPRHPATLRNEVTSPGGTSAEALYHLEKGSLRTVLSRAIWAAYQRSIALGEGDIESLLGSDKLEDDAAL